MLDFVFLWIKIERIQGSKGQHKKYQILRNFKNTQILNSIFNKS